MSTLTAPRGLRRLDLASLLLYLLLLIGALIMIFPVLWMGMSTFKAEAEISAYPPSFLPSGRSSLDRSLQSTLAEECK